MTKKAMMTLVVATALALAGSVLAHAPAGAHDQGHSRFSGWFERCYYSRSAQIDPIVNPGARSAHMHDFFGGDVRADSTRRQLLDGPTTCRFNRPLRTSRDHSGYWAPSVYTADGVKRTPYTVQAYAFPGRNVNPHEVTPWPAGTKAVFRDEEKGARYGGARVAWYCGSAKQGNNKDHRNAPYDCTDPAFPMVAVEIFTPNCMKQATTDTRPSYRTDGDPYTRDDHFSHMRYSTKEGCPPTHPKEVPQMRLVFKYETSRGRGLKLAGADGAYENPATDFHADFFDGWKRDELDRLMRECVYADVDCGEDGVAG